MKTKKINFKELKGIIDEFVTSKIRKKFNYTKIFFVFLFSFFIYFLSYATIIFFSVKEYNKNIKNFTDIKLEIWKCLYNNNWKRLTNKNLDKKKYIKISFNELYKKNNFCKTKLRNHIYFENYKKKNLLIYCDYRNNSKIWNITFSVDYNKIKKNMNKILFNYFIFLFFIYSFLIYLNKKFFIDFKFSKEIEHEILSDEDKQKELISEIYKIIKDIEWELELDSAWNIVLNEKEFKYLIDNLYILYYTLLKHNFDDIYFPWTKLKLYTFIKNYKNIYEVKKYIYTLANFKVIESFYLLKNKKYFKYFLNFSSFIISYYMTSSTSLLIFLIIFIYFNSNFLQLITWWNHQFLYYMYETMSIVSNLWWDVNFNSNIWYIFWIYLQLSWILLFWLLIWIFEKRIVV